MAEKEVCGHINKHSYNTRGKLEDLSCTLEKGHDGDHSAPYKKNVGESVHDEKGRIVSVKYTPEESIAYWNDGAGVLAKEIKVGDVGQMNMFQKDIVMQILSKNPNTPVEQAIAEAKERPEWNSVTESG